MYYWRYLPVIANFILTDSFYCCQLWRKKRGIWANEKRKNNLNVKFDRLHNDIYMDEGMQFSISGHSPLGLFPAETLKDTDVIKVAKTSMPVLF